MPTTNRVASKHSTETFVECLEAIPFRPFQITLVISSGGERKAACLGLASALTLETKVSPHQKFVDEFTERCGLAGGTPVGGTGLKIRDIQHRKSRVLTALDEAPFNVRPAFKNVQRHARTLRHIRKPISRTE